ncbi:MAG TPA: phage portal protein [Candidatus Limnocylindrales bacterium]|nr:phage portal protein [Candidatus Limnocylindrales bacterium]
MSTAKQIVRRRGDLVSFDGGQTFRAAAGWYGDAAHMGASVTSRELAGWNPVSGSGDSDLLGDRTVLVPRARDLDRNHGIAQSARQTKSDNIVGLGFRLSPTPDYRALGKTKEWAIEFAQVVRSYWREFSETTNCDAAGTHNFLGLTRQVFNGCMLNGDAVALAMWLPSGSSRFATKLQVMESDRLSTPIGRIDGSHMRGGIEIDDLGKPTKYWIRKTHPGDAYIGILPDAMQWEPVPAETPWGRKRVIHVADLDRAGQHRGKPDLSAVLAQFKMLDHYQRTTVQAAVVQAMIAAFIETPMDSTALAQLFGGDINSEEFKTYLTRKNEYRVKLQGGAVVPMFPGDKMTAFTPSQPTGVYGPFVENVLRHISAGLDVPLELLLKDFSKINYSGARSMLLEAWRFFVGRRKWLTDFWATPVYELFLEEIVNAGLVEAPDFYEHRFAYSCCKWIGSGKGWVDPQKEAQAAETRMRNYLTTLEDECAEQGRDWEEVLEQRAAERAKMAELNLPLPEVLESRQPLDLQEAETADDEAPGKAAPGGPDE